MVFPFPPSAAQDGDCDDQPVGQHGAADRSEDTLDPQAAVVSPMNYSQILWATIFGALLFDEVPDIATLLGSLVIIASGLYLLMREQIGARSVMRPVLTTLSRLPIAPAGWSAMSRRKGSPRRREDS